MSFGITTVLTLAVYLFTLTPDIGLGNDGYTATSAMYGGVSMPAGFPVWTIWAWVFTKLLPIYTIGWRVAFASALAGALASGLIALLVSWGGAELVGEMRSGEIVRISAGASAGLVFGLNGAFWRQAVIPDPWPMSLLLLCAVICLLLRWSAQPERRRFLLAAAFLYGLTLTNSQIALALAAAIPFAVAISDVKLGRDLFATAGLFYLLIVCRVSSEVWQSVSWGSRAFIFHLLGSVDLGVAVALTIRTRRLYSEWCMAWGCAAMLGFGCLMYFYLPLTGMTNPPGNWAYPRTAEGFFHLIDRDQYDRINMTRDLKTFIGQIWLYAGDASRDFGWPCLLAAAAPFCFWQQLNPILRKQMFAMTVLYGFLTLLMIAVLNPTPERQTGDLVRMYFSMPYVVLAVWMGFGLILLGRLFLLANSAGATTFKKNTSPAA